MCNFKVTFGKFWFKFVGSLSIHGLIGYDRHKFIARSSRMETRFDASHGKPPGESSNQWRGARYRCNDYTNDSSGAEKECLVQACIRNRRHGDNHCKSGGSIFTGSHSIVSCYDPFCMHTCLLCLHRPRLDYSNPCLLLGPRGLHAHLLLLELRSLG